MNKFTKATIGLAAFATITLTGACGVAGTALPAPTTSSPPAPKGDAFFLAQLRDAGIDTTDTSLGHSVCAAYDRGVASLDLVKAGTDSGLTSDQATTVVAASIVAYCPEYEQTVTDEYKAAGTAGA